MIIDHSSIQSLSRIGKEDAVSDNAYTTVQPIMRWLSLLVDDAELATELSEFHTIQDQVGGTQMRELIDIMGRYSAVESIAIEEIVSLKPGQSRMVATEASNWESVFSNEELSLSSFQSQLDAFEFVRELSRDSAPITESMVRDIHSVACKGQTTVNVEINVGGAPHTTVRELKKGCYRENDCYVISRKRRRHSYAPSEEVAPEMARFVAEMQSEQFQTAHPIIQSAYAHYGLTHIHPFEDGNGRAARSLASLFLYRHYDIPLLIFSDRKQTYYQALEFASKGEPQELVNQLATRATSALSQVVQMANSLESQSAIESMAELVSTLEAHVDVELPDPKSVAKKAGEAVITQFSEKVKQLNKNASKFLQISQIPSFPYHGRFGSDSLGQEYDTAASVGLRMQLKSNTDVDISSQMYVLSGYSRNSDSRYPFIIASSTNVMAYSSYIVAMVKFRFEDLHPDVGLNARDRITQLVDKSCAVLIQNLHARYTDLLTESGERE